MADRSPRSSLILSSSCTLGRPDGRGEDQVEIGFAECGFLPAYLGPCLAGLGRRCARGSGCRAGRPARCRAGSWGSRTWRSSASGRPGPTAARRCSAPSPCRRSAHPARSCALMVLEGAGEDLAGAGAVVIDQDVQRHPPADPAAGVVELRLALGPPAGRDDQPRVDEPLGDLDGDVRAGRPDCPAGRAPGLASPGAAGRRSPRRSRRPTSSGSPSSRR